MVKPPTASVCASFDYDQDGDLDLYIGTSDQGGAVYRNTTSETGTNGYLTVKAITDSDGNATDGIDDDRPAIGARIDVDMDQVSDFTFTAAAVPGSPGSAQSQQLGLGNVFRNEPVAHFGLKDISKVTVRATFPDRSIVTCTDVPANTLLVIKDFAGETATESATTTGQYCQTRERAQ